MPNILDYIPESVKTALLFILVFGTYCIVSDDDYHNLVDKVVPIKYTCEMIGDIRYINIPKKFITECTKRYYDEYRKESPTIKLSNQTH